MARLSDVPLVVRRVGLLTFLRRVWAEVEEDHLFTWGAALAYAWLFAIFPFLIFLLTLIPYLPDKVVEEAYTRIPVLLYEWLPDPSAYTIWENIEKLFWGPPKGLVSIGLLVTVWAASGGINMTMTALDRCYEVERGRSFLRRRVVAVGITLIVAVMILSVLVLIPVGNMATRYVVESWPEKLAGVPRGLLWAWNGARYVLAGVLMFLCVSVLYYFGIAVRQRFRIFSPGAVFTIAVWMGLAFGFRWYVNSFGKESYSRTYGTVGGVAVLLLFFYLDALVLMIGAEINSEIDYEVLGVERGCRDFTVPPQPMFADQSHPSAPPTAAAAAAAVAVAVGTEAADRPAPVGGGA
jgi:membrane protein